MVICVFGSASDKIKELYKEKSFEMGRALAERGHSLIFGAGSSGLMGATARGFKAGNGKIHGVIPKFFEEDGFEEIFYQADKLTYTSTMAERKTKMGEGCDAFVIVPGGIGTFEEFFEIFTLKQLGRHKKAIAIYNIDGYYKPMIELIEYAINAGFINEECRKLIKVFTEVEELIEYLENYSKQAVKWDMLK